MQKQTGFHSLSGSTDVECSIEGELPPWLDGTMLRNGPGTFSTADGEVDHWFDGLAMVRSFSFQGDTLGFRTRFLETDAYESAQSGSFAGFATGQSGFLERLRYVLFEPPYDNTNIIVERIGDDFVALTETPRWVRVDPDTLRTLGDVERSDDPVGDIACAHVQHDPWTGEAITVETDFGRRNAYHCVSFESPRDRSVITSIPVDKPAYMHSFAATRNYMLLTEFPFVLNPMALLRPGEMSFVDAFEWEPDRGLRMQVIDRRTGEVVATPTTDARFGFHHVNAYEPDGEDATIVFDLETVPDAEPLKEFSLASLRAGDYESPLGRLHRYRVELDERAPGGARVQTERLYDGGTALPVVSPEVRMRRHRYVYGQDGPKMATDWPRSIVKIDVETGHTTTYDPDAYVNEPLFVPAPEERRTAEDDGVVLVVALDEDTETSRLVVLDGQTLEERATADLPVALPIGFHGRYFQSF